ncbi:DoxX family protein [Agromyces laixinhei]|uniref:DoxX family protein n=1 Tax=Agromyces laixinhei TaxID=2585717 RepID=UPI0012ED1D4D|nr:DoxX family protein [Agromyces laixinhei]
MINPWWPLAILAAIQLVDAALCWRPVRFIADCLTDVRFPRQQWWILTPIKLAAAAGLALGIWLPPLAALTSAALVAYFLVAISMHIRARDFGRNLFVNATGMLALSTAELTFVIVQML